ncbi:DNA repair protein rhp57 [Vanrija albida]|uniref:DNA repair protein rhp57 n=1 Tax=Vanrija albida TaxID=181172 RepID=A0ABR3QC12_9TREE
MSFASFPLDTLPLKPAQSAAAKRAGFATAADVLLLPHSDVSRKLRAGGVSIATSNKLAQEVIHDVATALTPASHRLTELLADDLEQVEDDGWIRTGDPDLDEALGGGIHTGVLTELVGESAAGKSHLTSTFALAAGVPGLSSNPGGAIVLTSERVLSTDRLVELAPALLARAGADTPVSELLDNIHTSRIGDIDSLEHTLQFIIPHMLESRRWGTHSPLKGEIATDERPQARAPGQKPIRVLVIDSITALLRGETATSGAGLVQRSRHLCTVADRLKALAVEYELAVVVVNQVSDVFFDRLDRPLPPSHSASSQASAVDEGPDQPLPPMLYATQARLFSGQSPGVAKEASLGIVWANAVNVRVMLARTGRRRKLAADDILHGKKRKTDAGATVPLGLEFDDKPALVRRLHVVFSPFSSPGTLDYVIMPSGIHSLPGTFKPMTLGPALRRRDMRLLAKLGEQPDEAEPAAPVQTQPVAEDVADEVEVYDDLGDLPPEFWEGGDIPSDDPVAVGVVE